MASALCTVALLALLSFGDSYVIHMPRATADNGTSAVTVDGGVPELFRRAGDPTSFAWVHRLAAIGDSFTAGIGSGNQLGDVFHRQNDWKCSRYDLSYPMLINNLIGPSINDFQFPACSGDRSVQINEQVRNLKGNLNMVVMTAGGNDLCLVWSAPSTIKFCPSQMSTYADFGTI
jgi:lysophospholipase L1-like esterase